MNTIRFFDALWQDLAFGARLLWRNPTFALVAILTLALGTGANTAIFQLVDAVRIRALPVKDPQQLVALNIDTHDKGRTGRFISRRPFMTDPLWQRIGADQQVFSSMLAWGATTFDLATSGESRIVQGIWVNGEFFETLRVGPHIGRVFNAGDDQRGCAGPGVVLSHGFWQRQFGSDPGVLGRGLVLDGVRFDVVGVTPQSFFGVEVGRSFDVAVPICSEPLVSGAQTALGKPDVWFLELLGRLKPGQTLEQAQAHLAAISSGVFKATIPTRYTSEEVTHYEAFTLIGRPAGTGVSSLRGTYATPLWVLLGVTGLVLLIACANLANLMLARATAREREIAVRLALGASRRRIVRQLFSESLLIAVIGAAAGIPLATWLSRFLVTFLSTSRNQLFVDLSPDWRVFAFNAALAVTSCLLFGLTPAIRATATNPGSTMKQTSRGTTDTRERFGIRRALVVVQVALSLVLVVGAILLARSLRNLTTLEAGFRQDHLLIANLDLRGAGQPADRIPLLQAQIMERLQAIPGVHAAAQAMIVPVSGSGWNNRVVVDGKPQRGISNFNAVSPGFFKVLGTRLVAGRDFDARDTAASPRVAVVNQLFASRYFGSRDPLGQSFHIETAPGEPRVMIEIVGVVEDTKYTDLREEFKPLGFFPSAQEGGADPFLQAVVWSDQALAALTPAVTRTVLEINPNITLQYKTMASQVRDSLLSERLMATLSGFFGCLAGLIATIGLYGVMSYMVARRRTEIGIRMALGADRGQVVRMIVREAGGLLIVGVVVGAVLAVFAARFATVLLYGLQPWDPTTLALSIGTLASVALLASWLPAHRASRLEPTMALRED